MFLPLGGASADELFSSLHVAQCCEIPGWISGKGSAPECGGQGTCFPGQWLLNQAAGVQGVFGQCYQAKGLNFGWTCVEPGVGVSDSCEFLPAESILSFSDLIQSMLRMFSDHKELGVTASVVENEKVRPSGTTQPLSLGQQYSRVQWVID